VSLGPYGTGWNEGALPIASKPTSAMSHERNAQGRKASCQQEINALMRKAEILDARKTSRHGKSGKLGQ